VAFGRNSFGACCTGAAASCPPVHSFSDADLGAGLYPAAAASARDSAATGSTGTRGRIIARADTDTEFRPVIVYFALRGAAYGSIDANSGGAGSSDFADASDPRRASARHSACAGRTTANQPVPCT